MKKVLFFLLLIIAITSSFSFAETLTLPGAAEGREFNNLLNRWMKRQIECYIDEDGNLYVMAKTAFPVRGYLLKNEIPKFISLLEKSMEWSSKAKKEKVEITKELGSFLKEGDHRKYGIKLTFFAANKGNQTDVIFDIKDFENMFYKGDFYIDPVNVKKIIDITKKAESSFKTLQERQAKAKEFK